MYHDRHIEGHVPFQEYRIANIDSVYTISNHGFEYLRKKIPQSMISKVKLCRLGVEDKSKGHLPTKNSQTFTIVSCSSVIPLKRVDLIADVLRHTTLPIRWIHFGSGPQASVLQEKIKEMPPNISVELRGETRNDEILKFYDSEFVDVFVSLSESEGLPVSMMEAISFGIPIFAVSVNGIPEIVTKDTGVLLDIHSTQEQITKLLEDTLQRKHFNRQTITNFFQRHFNAEANYNLFINDVIKIMR
jgi:glycosyltransferase involved in cell wall biosynthesis